MIVYVYKVGLCSIPVYTNTAVLFWSDNRITKIIVKQYYHNIDIIAILAAELPDLATLKFMN